MTAEKVGEVEAVAAETGTLLTPLFEPQGRDRLDVRAALLSGIVAGLAG